MIRDRIVSGLVLGLGILIIVLVLPALWSTVALSGLLLAGAWEWSAFQGPVRLPARLAFVIVAVLCCALLWSATAEPVGMRRVLWFAVVFWTAALAWIVLLPRPLNRLLVWIAGLAALSFAWIALARMRMNWQLGEYWVLYALCIVWVADSGAYFAGRRWGRRKLAPRISPGKTWAGLAGGVAAAALLAIIATPWLARSTLLLVLTTVIVALYSVVGDLTESLFKRHAGLKDSGALIPGHGGVLDRFDSLLAAAPLLMLGASLLGRMPG